MPEIIKIAGTGFMPKVSGSRIDTADRTPMPGSTPTVYLGGFKAIIDMAFAKDGTLYVLQYASSPSGFGGPGQIVRVAPNGTRTVLETGAALLNPAGIAIGPRDGALYVTNKTVTPGGGEVLRIVP